MSEPRPISFDAPLGQRIIELHVWAVRQGLLGTAAAELFDGFCQRLVLGGLPLWRASAAMRTLHPQWGGYSYLWRRDLNAIEPSQFERDNENSQVWLTSPFAYLVGQARAEGGSGDPWRHLRRHLCGPEALLDFPLLEELARAGGTDYFAQIVRFGPEGDASRGTGIAYSFTTDRREGFSEDDLTLLRAVLPALSLAIMAHAGHTIASGLLEAYLGGDAGRRVHAGAVERGSVESIRAVLWFADMRGFTKLADGTAGLEVIELLDEVFETLTAPLRSRGGEVLKFMGDGMLAIFPLPAETQAETCRDAIDAAREAMHTLDRINRARAEASQAGRRGRPRAPYRGSVVRQCRRRRSPRFHGDRAAPSTRRRALKPCANLWAARSWSRPSLPPRPAPAMDSSPSAVIGCAGFANSAQFTD